MILPNHVLEKMNPKDRAKLGKAGMTAGDAAAKQILKSEKELQNLIEAELNRRDIWICRSAMYKKTTTKKGTPDFLFCFYGKFCAVEAKHERNTPTPEQEKALAMILSNGGRVVVVRSFSEFLEFLNNVQNDSSRTS